MFPATSHPKSWLCLACFLDPTSLLGEKYGKVNNSRKFGAKTVFHARLEMIRAINGNAFVTGKRPFASYTLGSLSQPSRPIHLNVHTHEFGSKIISVRDSDVRHYVIAQMVYPQANTHGSMSLSFFFNFFFFFFRPKNDRMRMPTSKH